MARDTRHTADKGWFTLSSDSHEHPMQPIVWDGDGVIRFKANSIVRYILDNGSIDLNRIATMNFDREDREQFAQLIGYSVSGFGDLSYVRRTTLAKADEIADTLVRKRKRKAKP